MAAAAKSSSRAAQEGKEWAAGEEAVEMMDVDDDDEEDEDTMAAEEDEGDRSRDDDDDDDAKEASSHSERDPPEVGGSFLSEKEKGELLTSLGMDERDLHTRSGGKYRFNAIHVRGVNDMSTDDIYHYFKDFGSPSVEWINDCSCNVVWSDSSFAWKALTTLSNPIIMDKVPANKEAEERQEKEGDVVVFTEEEDGEIASSPDHPNENMDAKDAEVPKPDVLHDASNGASAVLRSAILIPVPPGSWRYAHPHSKAKALLMRFAMKSDRKLPGAEKRSEYYQKYGNPNYGGLKGIISTSRKRKYRDGMHKDEGFSGSGHKDEGFGGSGHKDEGFSGSGHKEEGFSGSGHSKLSVANTWANIAMATSEMDTTKKPKKLRMKMYADEEAQKSLRRNTNRESQINSSDLRRRLDANRSRSHFSRERRPKSPTPSHHQPRGGEDDLRSKLHSKSLHVSSAPAAESDADDLRKKLDKLRQARTKEQRSLLKIQVLEVDA